MALHLIFLLSTLNTMLDNRRRNDEEKTTKTKQQIQVMAHSSPSSNSISDSKNLRKQCIKSSTVVSVCLVFCSSLCHLFTFKARVSFVSTIRCTLSPCTCVVRVLVCLYTVKTHYETHRIESSTNPISLLFYMIDKFSRSIVSWLV